MSPDEVYVVSVARTPIGSFLGSLSSLSAVELGATALSAAWKRAPEALTLNPDLIDHLYVGQVLTAGCGQHTARQVAHRAQLPDSVPCTSINKVCASGMQAIQLSYNAIRAHQADCCLAVGMESMSRAPHLLPTQARLGGIKYGHSQILDSCMYDGLTDPKYNCLMGDCAELTASRFKVDRSMQDAHALESNRRAIEAWRQNKFDWEVVPVSVPAARPSGSLVQVACDEQIASFDAKRLQSARPVFQLAATGLDPVTLEKTEMDVLKEKYASTVTAGNASPLSDGAAALVLVSGRLAIQLQLPVIARIVSHADAAQMSPLFAMSPSLALPKALKRASLSMTDLDFVEMNEAFSCMAVANRQVMQLNPEKVNVYGGAVALGHPLGCSGARIVVTLISVLRQEKGHYGAAVICNGGGGASALILERIE